MSNWLFTHYTGISYVTPLIPTMPRHPSHEELQSGALSRYARTILSRLVADRIFQIPLPRVQVSFNAIRN